MNLRTFPAQILVLLVLGIAQAALADEPSPSVSLGGFGTLGGAYHEADGLEYRRSINQKHGTRSGQLDFGIDSMLGAQLTARANSQIDGMLQAVSRQNADSSWRPRLTWAFLRYAPNDNWQVRAGRLGLDTQLYADSRAIGYSYLTVRPRLELFGNIPFDSFDGFDTTYRQPAGANLLAFKFFHGVMNGEFPVANQSPAKFATTHINGLIATLTHDDLQLRAIYGKTRLQGNGDTQPLIDALNSTGFASASVAADQINVSGRHTSFGELEAVYDQGPLSLQASWLVQKAPRDSAILPTSSAFSLLGGYRVGDFKPYLGYSRMRSSTATASSGLPAYGQLIVLDQAVNAAAAGYVQRQQSLSLGVRYDFATNMAFKLQVDQVRAKHAQLVTGRDPSDSRYASLTLLSACLDFVF